jgi:hypothetical protein
MTEKLKSEIIDGLLSLGYNIDTAKELYAKHEDIAEVNSELLSGLEIAIQLEEQDLQGYDDDDE